MENVKKDTAKYLVFQELDKRVELGGLTEYRAIQAESELHMPLVAQAFIHYNAHRFTKPIKTTTINRYYELWLKKNKERF